MDVFINTPMLINDILNEAATAPLYHGTSFAQAMEIVQDGAFQAYSGMPGPKREPYYGLSTTRSPRLAYIDHDPNKKPWDMEENLQGFNVIFVLDQNKIRQRFQIIPYDYFRGKERDKFSFYKDVSKLRHERSESEEFISLGKGGKLPLKGNVTKIMYFPGSFKDPDDEPSTDTYFTFQKWALTHSIPVVINRSLFGYSDHERPWTQELRRSMITHPDKQEVQFDPKDSETKTMQRLAKKYEQADAKNLAPEQLEKLFNKGEIFGIWNFWLRMNARFPGNPPAVIAPWIIHRVFQSIKKVDPKHKTVYRKITPFVAAKKATKI